MYLFICQLVELLVTNYLFRVERDPQMYLFVLFLLLIELYSNLGLGETCGLLTHELYYLFVRIEIDPYSVFCMYYSWWYMNVYRTQGLHC